MPARDKNQENPPQNPPAHAMLLAAGRGERMRPLTDTTPKPLLRVRGHSLLHWHLAALHTAGIQNVLINTGWLGEQIPAHFGSHFQPGPQKPSPPGPLQIEYSREEKDFGHTLETAGGIIRALPRLAPIFWLAAGDVYMPGFEFGKQKMTEFAQTDDLAHLWLVPNPAHHPDGDFEFQENPSGRDTGRAINPPPVPPNPHRPRLPRYTYSTVALLRAELFAPPWSDIPPGNPQGRPAPLAPLLRRAMQAGRVGATLWRGPWTDVGTPQRLAQLNAE